MADVTESQDVEPRADGDAESVQPLDALLQAVKIAAAGAAVGAAAAAARALSHRDEEQPDEEEDERAMDEVDDEPHSEAQEEPQAEAQEEPKPQEREDSAVDRHGADKDEEPVQGVPPSDAKQAVTRAREQLEELLERPVESVSSFERTHDGWRAAFEVLQLSRVPESTDILASYEIELDDDLNLRGYHQVRRYHRSQADRGEDA
jgi:hypothetical protein